MPSEAPVFELAWFCFSTFWKQILVKQNSSRKPAVDRQACACNKSRFLAGEISDQSRDFINRAITRQGHQFPQHVSEFTRCGVQIRVNWPRLDIVDGNPA